MFKNHPSKVAVKVAVGEFKTINISSAPVLAYEQAILVATDTYLAGLTIEELNRRVNFAGSELSGS
jgi:hypothetical protein